MIERRGDAGIQTECSVSSPNVRTARCAKSHGYDRCIYYRARSLSTGAVLLRRQCATKKMCDGECLSFNHTDCQMKCCQGDLCNNGFFDVKKAKDDPDIEAAVIPGMGKLRSRFSSENHRSSRTFIVFDN